MAKPGFGERKNGEVTTNTSVGEILGSGDIHLSPLPSHYKKVFKINKISCNQKINMKIFPSFEGSSSREELKKYLEENKLAFSFNKNPERFISKSITPTNLQKYLTCPHCFFESKKKTIKIPNHKENESVMVSNTIHFLLEYLFRNEDQFQKSLDVLNFIDFEEGNFLEFLKTEEDNSNYDLLNYLVDLEDEAIKEKIIKGVLIGYGTAKKLKFEEIRKKDSISLNLQNTINKGSTTIYAKPDLTGRHPTTNPKTLRKYDNFLIDYKLQFNPENFSNSIQTNIYFLTHLLSNRDIHHFYILDLTDANFYKLKETNLGNFIDLLNNFLVLRNINYRGKNEKHLHQEISNLQKEINIQGSFFGNSISKSGGSFGSKIYDQVLLLIEELNKKTIWEKVISPVTKEEIAKINSKYIELKKKKEL